MNQRLKAARVERWLKLALHYVKGVHSFGLLENHRYWSQMLLQNRRFVALVRRPPHVTEAQRLAARRLEMRRDGKPVLSEAEMDQLIRSLQIN